MPSRLRVWLSPFLGRRPSRPSHAPRASHPRDFIDPTAIVTARLERPHGDHGTLVVGEGSIVHGRLSLSRPDARIHIGRYSLVDTDTWIGCCSAIDIEDEVLIAGRCWIADADGHSLRPSVRRGDLRRYREGRPSVEDVVARPVTIATGAWIGAHSVILRGVRVGCGAVVGAGSVVLQDVPDFAIAAGNPARVLRVLAEHER